MGLYQKMVQVMQEVGQLRKDGSVTDRSGRKMYDYLSEEQVTGELQKALIKHGLVIFPVNIEDRFFYVEGSNSSGTYKTPITEVKVSYKIVDVETGEQEILMGKGQGSDSGDKASNKALTGAYKYAMRQSFAISTGDDGDREGSEPGPSRSTSNTQQQRRGSSAAILDKVTQQGAKQAADNPLITKIKGAYQAISPSGDLQGFEEFYESQQKKNLSDQRILEFLQKKAAEKQAAEGKLQTATATA